MALDMRFSTWTWSGHLGLSQRRRQNCILSILSSFARLTEHCKLRFKTDPASYQGPVVALKQQCFSAASVEMQAQGLDVLLCFDTFSACVAILAIVT